MSKILFKIIAIGASALFVVLLAFFKGKKSGEKKADKEISEFKAYAEEEIRKAVSVAAEATADKQKLERESSSLVEAVSIVTKKTQDNNPALKELVEASKDKSAMKSAIRNLIADSMKKAEEANNR